MSNAPLFPVIDYIRKVTLPPGGPDPLDAALLERFVLHRDERAFAALVERHGPLVLGVCRRVLRDAHDAEDAFQATFLVLARKAGSLRRPGSLGPWLHGVAYRTALKARARSARCRTQEVREHDRAGGDPAEEAAWRDLRPVLDDAIDGLPERYRVPFVLCYLEGKTNAEAAEHLCCPRGTIATRLARARDRLRASLGRRGVTLPAGVFAVLPARATSAGPVAPELARSFARAAAAVAAGRAAPTPALSLMKGVTLTMLTRRLRAVVAVLAAALGVGAASWSLAHRARAAGDDVLPPPAVPVLPPDRVEEPPAGPGRERTPNFVVDAPNARVARLVAEAAERHRKELARLWLGRELAPWPRPCPIRVTITASGTGGATAFAFDDGRVTSQDMRLEGPLDRILTSVLPHEVAHAVFAHALGRSVPRWADEGGAILAEDEVELRRHERVAGEYHAAEGRFVPLQRLFALTDYPRDVLAFHVQSYSVARFLVGRGGRKTFFAFVRQGARDGWEAAVREHYSYRGVVELEEAWLATFRRPRPGNAPPPVVAGFPLDESLLPTGPQPLVLLARADGEGRVRIFVRIPVTSYRLRPAKGTGKEKEGTGYYYEPVREERPVPFDAGDVRAFDTAGKQVDVKKLARLLAKETPVLVSADGRPVDPFYLRVVKDGTLVLVLPPGRHPPAPAPPPATPILVAPPAPPSQ